MNLQKHENHMFILKSFYNITILIMNNTEIISIIPP